MISRRNALKTIAGAALVAAVPTVAAAEPEGEVIGVFVDMRGGDTPASARTYTVRQCGDGSIVLTEEVA